MSRTDFEVLLREALTPVDPPESLGERLEGMLTSLTEIAAEELESWERSSMRDPRNWIRPAFALVVGTGAGAALVLLRIRRRPPQSRLARGRAAAGQALRDAGHQARRLIG